MSGFVELLKKDWRLNRAPVIALVVSVVAPYLFVAIANLTAPHQESRPTPTEIFSEESLEQCALVGLAFLALVAAAFGGNAFATERRERWADFLAMLPVSRWQILLSKLIIACGSLLVGWGVHATATTKFWGLFFDNPASSPPKIYANAILGMFGIAWCLSIVLESAAISASVAIAILWGWVWAVDFIFGTLRNSEDSTSLAFIWLPVTLLTIIVSDYYVRRVAP